MLCFPRTKVAQVQTWPKKFVVGCVVPPAGALARSRNQAQPFLATSVHIFAIPVGYCDLYLFMIIFCVDESQQIKLLSKGV